MKRCIIAPAYASAIRQARKHIPGYLHNSETLGKFSSENETEDGLKWYHELFPSIKDLDADWKPVGEALYKNFIPFAPVLPVAMSVPKRKMPRTEALLSYLSGINQEIEHIPVKVTWYEVSEAYFCTNGVSWSLEKTLLGIGFHLLTHTPLKVHESFIEAERNQDVSPEQVWKFLRNSREIKGNLPKNVEATSLHDARTVHELTSYCAQDDKFAENLEEIPLLLTQDGILRCFHRKPIVFCSRFSQLLPSKPELFLHHRLLNIFAGNLDKCSNVMQKFCLSDLAKFQSILFPTSWMNTASHQPWNSNGQDEPFPSQEWLKLIWEFIDNVSASVGSNDEAEEDNTSNALQDISSWHIIPTTQNYLVPVSMGKTVLNVSTPLNSDSPHDKAIRELLVKLDCPQLNHTILISTYSRFSPTGGATGVRKHYLAKIQSTKDVLGLLHEALNSNTRGRATLTIREIERLLTFLQGDFSCLSLPVLRSLPFYQTIDGTYTRLSTDNTVYEVAAGVPGDGLHVLSEVTNSIFLHQNPKLADLYQYIGIKPASSIEFYINIVLKYFDRLTPEGRVNHLKFVRDYLLHEHYEGYRVLLPVMEQLSFIPDRSGALLQAREFYNPDNTVFKKFVPDEKFPPSPFDSVEWRDFLKKVGLQCAVTKNHFLQYAKQLEEEARNRLNLTSDKVEEILKKSDVLVSHLFDNNSLHTPSLLSQISEICFVPAAKVNKLFLDIHHSHTQSILTCFNDSVIEKHSALVWSSASLIASSAFPYRRNNLVKMLGLRTSPPHEVVISHAINISAKSDVPTRLQATFSSVMTTIYSYLRESCHLTSGPPVANCSQECRTTRLVLRDIPVILVDQQRFVRGSQLAFSGVLDSLNPYMFNIPRPLQQFEHFLKCLGAQEYPTPLQCSSILATIKGSCGDNQMTTEEKTAAVDATKCLFKRLSEDKRNPPINRGLDLNLSQSLRDVPTLYLPTVGDVLKSSREVFVNDIAERKERLREFRNKLLVDLTMKDEDPPARLVKLLPKNLRVQILSSILTEELSPDCQPCILDAANRCDVVKPYRVMMCSSEFSKALCRVYKRQEEIDRIPQEVENDLRRLEKGVKIKCMRTIKARLVRKETGETVPGSESDDVFTFCQKSSAGFSILIKHDGEANSALLHERLSSFISMITGQHIKEAQWRYLMIILGFRYPEEIPAIIDRIGIPRIDGPPDGPVGQIVEPESAEEAKRWLRQAQEDLDTARSLHQTQHYSSSCFHGQQATEKALKALMFAKGRLKSSDLEKHDVMGLAYRASEIDPRLHSIPTLVTCIQGYYIKTRYPDYQRGFPQRSIPADKYTQDEANHAVLKAGEVLLLIREVVN
ncbi:sacsin-like [Dendronephthya gigantea]|uniref:sacsin-like n=1 Tax=Dendronephthya gigantea TaxID=151771 RepID=UPI00106A56B6|nr:sacsin-like [Dendronephthya gigantea]